MGDTLVGKSTVTFVWIASTETAVEALKVFFEGHYEFMKEKSYKDGPLKLIHYSISESPEYEGMCLPWSPDKKGALEPGYVKFGKGEFPKTTGRTVFTLFEIYESEEGLHHHWIESAPWADEFAELHNVHEIELQMFNQMKVIQSLWD